MLLKQVQQLLLIAETWTANTIQENIPVKVTLKSKAHIMQTDQCNASHHHILSMMIKTE